MVSSAGRWSGRDRLALVVDEVGQLGVAQRADDRALNPRPQQLGGADVVGLGLPRAHEVAVGALADALDRGDRALERLDDLGHGDLAGWPREQVATPRAAAALHP